MAPASSPNADLPRFHHPELAHRVLRLGEDESLVQDGENSQDALALGAEHNRSWSQTRSVKANVGKVEVEGHQDALFMLADGENLGVYGSTEALLSHRFNVRTSRLGA